MTKLVKIDLPQIEALLNAGLIELKLTLSNLQKKQFIDYLQLLLKWNQTYNLVASHDANQILISHVFDSLSIAAYLEGKNILDVGSGAGFPGIPLAIIFPEKKFTLLDSIGKKIQFLTQVKIKLALQNVRVIQHRVEEYKSQACYDNIISRAVTSIPKLIDLTQHLLCHQGKYLMMKGIQHLEVGELSSAWQITTEPLFVPYLNKERCLIIIRELPH